MAPYLEKTKRDVECLPIVEISLMARLIFLVAQHFIKCTDPKYTLVSYLCRCLVGVAVPTPLARNRHPGRARVSKSRDYLYSGLWFDHIGDGAVF